MSDELCIKLAGADEQDDVMSRVEMFRAVVAASMGDTTDPNVIARSMCAAVIFAGTCFGTLIVADLAKDQDRRRVGESMLSNFRNGIEIGKRHAMRVATEQFGGQS